MCSFLEGRIQANKTEGQSSADAKPGSLAYVLEQKTRARHLASNALLEFNFAADETQRDNLCLSLREELTVLQEFCALTR